ncbi:MAG TPA: class I SAM-dependent methyltransferase [bacterium]|nr:class I SAM-dependent methyltransferase [bacterium]
MRKNEKINWGEFPEFYGPRDYFRNTLIIKKVKIFLKKGSNILDFGYGVGNLAIRLASLNYNVICYDVSELSIKFLEKRVKKLSIKIIKDKNLLFNSNKKIDGICCGEVLEHIEDDRSIINLFKNLLKNGGVCIITVPAKKTYWDRSDILAYHYRRYEKETFISLLSSYGFKIIDFYCFGPITLIWHKLIFLPIFRKNVLNRFSRKGSIKKILSFLFYFDFLFLTIDIWNYYLTVIRKYEKKT